MNEFWSAVGQLPMWLVGAIIGAIVFGGVHGLVWLLSGRKQPTGWTRHLPIVACALVFGGVNTLNREHRLANADPVEQAIQELKGQPLMQAIFKHEPSAEPQLRAMLQNLLKTTPPDELRAATRTEGAKFLHGYLTKYLLQAPTDAFYKLITHERDVLNGWRDKPDLCIAYFLSNGSLDPAQVSKDFVTEELSMKADLVEAAAEHPEAPPQNPKIDDVSAELTSAYQTLGYPLEDLDKVAKVPSLPRAEACRVVGEFSSAIASMEPARAVRTYKALTIISQQ